MFSPLGSSNNRRRCPKPCQTHVRLPRHFLFSVAKHIFSCARIFFFYYGENIFPPHIFAWFMNITLYFVIVVFPASPSLSLISRNHDAGMLFVMLFQLEQVCMYKSMCLRATQFQVFNVIINLNDFIMLGILIG